MLGFHMMHQNARDRVFPLTRANRVGTLLMFVVRNIFSRPERLRATMRNLAAAGEIPQWLAETPDPLGFLIHEGGVDTLPTPPIASCDTNRASMSCCLAPATRSICEPT